MNKIIPFAAAIANVAIAVDLERTHNPDDAIIDVPVDHYTGQQIGAARYRNSRGVPRGLRNKRVVDAGIDTESHHHHDDYHVDPIVESYVEPYVEPYVETVVEHVHDHHDDHVDTGYGGFGYSSKSSYNAPSHKSSYGGISSSYGSTGYGSHGSYGVKSSSAHSHGGHAHGGHAYSAPSYGAKSSYGASSYGRPSYGATKSSYGG